MKMCGSSKYDVAIFGKPKNFLSALAFLHVKITLQPTADAVVKIKDLDRE